MEKRVFAIFVVGLIEGVACWGASENIEQDWEEIALFDVISLRCSPELEAPEDFKKKENISPPQPAKTQKKDHKPEASHRRYQARRDLQKESLWKNKA